MKKIKLLLVIIIFLALTISCTNNTEELVTNSQNIDVDNLSDFPNSITSNNFTNGEGDSRGSGKD